MSTYHHRGGVKVDTANKTNTIKDTVYKQILYMISTGEMTTDVIITENQMIKYFSASKAPVREALAQLCREGVLVSLPRCGYKVLEISPQNIRDNTELRILLELGSLSMVIKNMDSYMMGEIRALNEERWSLINTSRTVWALWDNNVRFHLKLNSFSGNVQVNHALQRALSTCTRAYAQLFAMQSAVMYPESTTPSRHDLIVSALEGQNLFDTHAYLKQDILYLQQRLLSGAADKASARTPLY